MPETWTIAHQFGQNVRWLRLSRGWTLDKLADAAGMSKTGVWEIEKGKSMPGIDTASKLAKALSVTVDSLLGSVRPEVPVLAGEIIDKIAELYRLTRPT